MEAGYPPPLELWRTAWTQRCGHQRRGCRLDHLEVRATAVGIAGRRHDSKAGLATARSRTATIPGARADRTAAMLGAASPGAPCRPLSREPSPSPQCQAKSNYLGQHDFANAV